MDDEDDVGPVRMINEFECSECNAHNPLGDGASDGNEVMCCYCGHEFRVFIRDGKVKLKSS
jgi:DNA-directed RNA polymerase subunit RPC12/RpoP